jgi:diaminopimelate epimerase
MLESDQSIGAAEQVSMGIRFTKMSGLGNDFLVVDNRAGVLGEDLAEFAKRHCRRRMNVGADGVLAIEHDSGADFRMRIINADGSEAEMCGNGARCAARFARVRGIAGQSMAFQTMAGLVHATVDDETVTIGMGEVAPVRPPEELDAAGGRWTVNPIEAGVPHAIVFTNNLTELDVDSIGRAIRQHEFFAPRGTNVDFVQVLGPQAIAVRTYERGVEAETLACGTGSIASAVVSHEVKGLAAGPIRVNVPGGLLTVDFVKQNGRATDVRLSGDAVFVYEGELC